MIAAVRLRRAAEAIQAARPYALKLHQVLSQISARMEGKRHPLLERRDNIKKLELLVITSDRGLCGGFNGNILRLAERFRKENMDKYEITISVIGRKGAEYFAARRIPVRKRYVGIYENLSFDKAAEVAGEIVDEYSNGTFDRVDLVYNEFKSAVSQKVTVETLLPIVPMEVAQMGPVVVDYEYEPSKEEVLDAILPRYFNSQVYRALLESVASEYGARMTAMESATNNASDMIGDLTLQYNRRRQAAITTELMEIIGGSEALKQ